MWPLQGLRGEEIGSRCAEMSRNRIPPESAREIRRDRLLLTESEFVSKLGLTWTQTD